MACDTGDVVRLNHLFRKYVGSGAPSARKLRAVIGREFMAVREKRVKATHGLYLELRNDYIAAGRLVTKCAGTQFDGLRRRKTRRSRRK